MDAAHLTATPDSPAVDLRRLDGTLNNLAGIAQALAAVTAALAEARARAAEAPDDLDARRAVCMAGLHLRGEAAALAEQLGALAREGAP